MFICGSRSFIHQDKDNHGSDTSPPKRSKRSKSLRKYTRKDNINKNPYADRGLDKFLALLADLDDKKQKIYNQMGSEDISFIRFVYSSDSEHVKPIVVKVKNKNTRKDFLKHTSNSTLNSNYPAAADASDKSVDEILEENNREMVTPQQQQEELVKKDERQNGSFRLDNLRHTCCCFPVMLVLILLFLALYGRSFAIVCTSIGWYLVPRIVEGTKSSSRSRREPKRKVSEKNILQSQSQHDNVT